MKQHRRSSCLFSPDSAKDIKHKISFLLQKPEHQTAEPKQKEKSAAAAAATAAKRSADTIFAASLCGSPEKHVWEFENGCKINVVHESLTAGTLMMKLCEV